MVNPFKEEKQGYAPALASARRRPSCGKNSLRWNNSNWWAASMVSSHEPPASAAVLCSKFSVFRSKSGQLAGKLSGGMKRRLNLALALVHDPEILVLDEPEAGLDPQSRVLVREYIRSLASHKTVILTTHNMDEAERLADRVAIIDHGRLLVVDKPGDLMHTVGEGDVLEVDVSEESQPGSASASLLVPGIAQRFSASVSTINHTLIAARSRVDRAYAGTAPGFARGGRENI